MDSKTTVKDLKNKVEQFVSERDWEQLEGRAVSKKKDS